MKVVLDTDKEDDKNLLDMLVMRDNILIALTDMSSVFSAVVNGKLRRIPKEYMHLVNGEDDLDNAEKVVEVLISIYNNNNLNKLLEY